MEGLGNIINGGAEIMRRNPRLANRAELATFPVSIIAFKQAVILGASYACSCIFSKIHESIASSCTKEDQRSLACTVDKAALVGQMLVIGVAITSLTISAVKILRLR